MSREALIQVLERASTDATFWEQLVSDSASALAGYSLSAAEHAALLSGDPEQLHALGVDPRLTRLLPWTDEASGGH